MQHIDVLLTLQFHLVACLDMLNIHLSDTNNQVQIFFWTKATTKPFFNSVYLRTMYFIIFFEIFWFITLLFGFGVHWPLEPNSDDMRIKKNMY